MFPLKTLSVLGRKIGSMGISYLLYDSFTTDRAAGAVNGTVSESPYPTGGGVVRTVVDTNGKIPIVANKLNFVSGLATNSGIWYPVQARISGKLIIANITPTSASIEFGFDTDNIGIISDSIIFYIAGDIAIRRTSASALFANGLWTSGTEYLVALVMRSTGVYFFIKGGTFTSYTLLFITTLGNSAMYPGMRVDNTSIAITDNIRIPVSTWLPTPLAYDTFTRADGAIGSTEANSPDGVVAPANPAPVLAWQNNYGSSTFVISSSSAKAGILDGVTAFAISTVNAGKADVLVSANLTVAAQSCGLAIRYVDYSNYIVVYRNTTQIIVDKWVGGVKTSLLVVANSPVAGAPLVAIMYGTKLRVYYNGAFIGSELTISDAILQSSTYHGIFANNVNNSIDNFTVFARGTGNEYAALDGF